VLLIDAAILGLKPGETRLVFPEQVTDFPAITTHVLPLRIFCEYITQATKARIGLLLIQPGRTEFGEGLTAKVAVSAKHIGEILLRILKPY
jgi:hydrogenase maturation protease